MTTRNRLGNPEHGYYPLPGVDRPLPIQGYPRFQIETHGLLDTPPATASAITVGYRKLTHDDAAAVAGLSPDCHDLPDDHAELFARGAVCLTCFETYPGDGGEHWLGWNTEAEMYDLVNAAHPGNWVHAEDYA